MKGAPRGYSCLSHGLLQLSCVPERVSGPLLPGHALEKPRASPSANVTLGPHVCFPFFLFYVYYPANPCVLTDFRARTLPLGNGPKLLPKSYRSSRPLEREEGGVKESKRKRERGTTRKKERPMQASLPPCLQGGQKSRTRRAEECIFGIRCEVPGMCQLYRGHFAGRVLPCK